MKKRLLSTLLVVCIILTLFPTFAYAYSVPEIEASTVIAAGYQHSGVIDENDVLWVWGSNNRGQLGNGTTEPALAPVSIMDNVKSVSMGMYHTAAVKKDGSLWLWGCNHNGELGNEILGNDKGFIWNSWGGKYYPIQTVPIKIMDNVSSVSCGGEYTAVIKTDGSLWMWGMNEYGQVGNGTQEPVTQPVKIMENVVEVKTGAYHTSAFQSDGTLWTWGNNDYSLIGNNYSLSPQKILDNVAKIDEGANNTAAIRTDGSLWMRGHIAYDGLYASNSNTMIQVLPNVNSVSLGYSHFGVIMPDNSLWLWGNGDYGRLGLAQGAQSDPTQMSQSTMNDIIAVDIGRAHTIAVKSDGSVWSWGGLNSDGQLGHGTTDSLRLPKQIPGLTARTSEAPDSTKDVMNKDGTFIFPGSNGKNVVCNYSYSDGFFYNPGSLYRHDLATMSLDLALSAFNSLEAPYAGYAENIAANNVRVLLSDLGFENIDTSSYEGKPTDHSVAVAIGAKEITDDEDTYTLIAVAIRGGGYEMEWANNFKVYSDSEHMGFSLSASDVSTNVLRYIQKNIVKDGETPKIKLWIVGYSRGAAIANLVGATYTDYATTDKLYPGVSLEKEDIYTYTFATPMATTELDRRSYTNIFNIINPIDIVPKVTPAAWGFGRYGRNVYIPTYEYDSDYHEYALEAVVECTSLCGSNYIQQAFPSQGAILDDVVNWTEILGGAESALSITIQNKLAENCIKKYDGTQTGETVSKILELWEIVSVAKDVLQVNLTGLAWNALLDSIKYVGKNTLEEEMGIIEMAHYPEGYLAWMNTLDLSDRIDNGRYRKVHVECPVNVSVYNQSNQLVAEIIDDEPKAVNTAGVGVYIDGDKRKTVVLSTDTEYHIVLMATNDGTMAYTVEECDIDSGKVDRIVSYQDIEIKKGDSLSGVVDDLDETPSIDYPLYRYGEIKSLTPDIDSKSNSEYITANRFTDVPAGMYYTDAVAWAVSNGITTGTSSITFSPDNPCTRSQIVTFLWRAAGSPIVDYSSIPFTDIDADAYYAEAVRWAVSRGITTGTSTTTFSPDIPCTRGQAVTFLYRYEGSPVTAGGNSFLDLAVGTYYESAVQWAVNNNITTGTSTTIFSPNTICSRGQIVTFLYRDMAK